MSPPVYYEVNHVVYLSTSSTSVYIAVMELEANVLVLCHYYFLMFSHCVITWNCEALALYMLTVLILYKANRTSTRPFGE